MEPFLRHMGIEYYALTLEHPGSFEQPFSAGPYPCLIWDTQGAWPEAERDQLVSSILDTDVRYAVCAGKTCEQWHDEIDQSFIMRYLDNEEERDRHFIMTTWHTDESPEDLAFFFVHNTDSDELTFKRFLILYLGRVPELAERLEAAVRFAAQDPERFVDQYPGSVG